MPAQPTIFEYSIPTAFGEPWVISAGSDGALWFTKEFANKIGRITIAEVITEFPLPTINGMLPLSRYPVADAALKVKTGKVDGKMAKRAHTLAQMT